MGTILGIDPGFANTGYVVWDPETGSHVTAGVIVTVKGHASSLSVEDNYQRCIQIVYRLKNLIDAWDVKLICFEAMSYTRNASSSAKVAMVHGVLAALATLSDIPTCRVTPQEVRDFVFDRASGQKRNKVEKVELHRLKGEQVLDPVWLGTFPKAAHEHIVDAAFAIEASKNHEMFKTALRFLT